MALFTKRTRPPGFTLVLGGGGARGLAHIGVLKALERERLRPRLIVGTSMGAIVGGMYAQKPNARLIEDRIKRLIQSKPFRRIVVDGFSKETTPDGVGTAAVLYGKMRRGYGLLKSAWSTGIVESDVLIDFLSHILDDGRIEECEIPFAAVACDLFAGEEVICTTGSILKAIAASSAIPGVVSPVVMNGRTLVDGAPTSTVPVLAAKRLSQLPLIAVTVTKDVVNAKPVRNAIDVMLRAGVISRMQVTRHNIEEASVVLWPKVGSYGWADFSACDEFIVEGEKAARSAIRKIKAVLDAS
jgi:NTE family protein